MKLLDDKDYELIKEAERIISLNYDDVNFNHTVGAAVRCKSGKIYVGVVVKPLSLLLMFEFAGLIIVF